MNLMNQQVLVLDISWEPHDIVTVFEAVNKMLNDKAQALDSNFTYYDFDSWVKFGENLDKNVVRSEKITFLIPEIIVLPEKTQHRADRLAVDRTNVYRRDNFICQYCERKFTRADLNMDHVFPKSRGGQHIWINVVTSCIVCNTRKGDRTPEEAGMQLIRKPIKPSWVEIMSGLKWDKIPQSWKDATKKLSFD